VDAVARSDGTAGFLVAERPDRALVGRSSQQEAPTMNPWNYPDAITISDDSLVGYEVEATDGSIGKVDAASHDPDDSYIVVDTGIWIVGEQRLVPASAVSQINFEQRKVFLSVDKDTVKSAPDHDDGHREDPAVRDQFAAPFIAPQL
jgi:hypothetical protein